MLGGDGAPAVAESGGSSEVGVSAEESERSGGGNRWPRQETLALLKIRSDMDVAFRDASLKGPLWEEVSRKMAEAGFQRSAKKCKEKFENVYKYHKRTKDGRSSKPDGKTYRFFDQLAALESTAHFSTPPPPRLQPPVPAAMAAPPLPTSHHVTVSSTSPTPLSVAPPNIVPNQVNSSFQQPLVQPPVAAAIPPPVYARTTSNSTSSSTSSDEDIQRRRGRKRKWKDYFERLMKDVIQKQEELQKKFLETLEKRERDRIEREEAWRVHEMARMNREHDRLIQERSAAAAKDAAVIAFLQKVTGEKQTPQIGSINHTPMQIQTPEYPQQPSLPPTPQPQQSTLPPPANQVIVSTTPTKTMEITNGGEDVISAGSSRWPKAEVEALIKLRTSMETKYQDNSPKGPLWEDISKAMAQLGYNRNAKRCKEKWENINKYFKKVKESNKKRPEDAKTCPYFHQLDAIYREKARSCAQMPPPIMARPEQQWPQPPALDVHESEDEEDEEEDEEHQYEMIAKASSLTNTME